MRIWLFALALLVACQGGPHRKGERMAVARVFGSPWPIKGNAIAWNGERDNEYIGGGIGNYWFVADRIALGVLLSATNHQYDGRNIKGIELEFAHRWYMWSHEEFTYFWDSHCGGFYAEDKVPEGATEHEYMFAFGPGMEIPVGEKSRVAMGFQFHHFSNANGRRADNNPSQNDFRLWISWGWMW